MSLTYTPGICNPVVNPISYSQGGQPPVTLQTISPTQLAVGGAGPLDLTTALAASPYTSSNTGVLFTNTGRVVLVVQASAATTVTSDIGTTVQGQTVPGVTGNIAAAGIYFYGPYPSQYDKQDGTADVEVDFGTPASVTAVLLLAIPGVV